MLFYSCHNLASIKISSTVTEIEVSFISGCSNLTKIEISENVAYLGADVFKNHNEDLVIYCQRESKAGEYAETHKIKL